MTGPPGERDARRIAHRLGAALPQEARSPAELEGLARAIVARASKALHKLDGAPLGALGAGEAAALEAVVHVRGRPAVRVLNDTLESIRNYPESDLWAILFDQHRNDVIAVTRATAALRVTDTLLGMRQWVQGTAVRIGDTLALTNRHVLVPRNGGTRLVRRVPGTREARLKRSYDMLLDFAFDNGPERAQRFRVTDVPFLAADEDPVDAAVVAIAPVDGSDVPAPGPGGFNGGRLRLRSALCGRPSRAHSRRARGCATGVRRP